MGANIVNLFLPESKQALSLVWDVDNKTST